MTRIGIVCALVACGRSEPIRRPPHEPAAVIPAATTQLVTAIVPDWTSTTATLRRWQRTDASSPWRSMGEPWTAVIGTAGAAWGSGLHGLGAPRDRTGPTKREGDGKSPAGAYAIGASYGHAARPPSGTQLPYTAVDASWQCVDDSASRQYNRVVDRRRVDVDWSSAEQMRRDDELYAWVIEIAHNPARAAHGGSCIFFHVWGGPDQPTVGCTALAAEHVAELLATLSPARAPAFVLLPRAEYAALADAWALPRE